jgi:peroxiredoxin
MNKFFYALLCLFALSCNEEKGEGFEVDGSIKNSGAQMVYLEETAANGNPVILDSAKLGKDGAFELNTQSKEENIYSLRLDAQPYPFVSLINDSKKISVDADFQKADDPFTIKGSEASQKMKEYLQHISVKIQDAFVTNKAIDSLTKNNVADSLIQPHQQKLNAISTELKQYVTQLVGNTKSPSLALFTLGTYQNYASNPSVGMKAYSESELNEILQKTAARFPEHTTLNQVKDNFKPKPAPDFSLPDINGKPVSLSSFKGKYVLVDFWASWCKPCRIENPNVVKAYQKFKDKNFTILGVSLDKEKEPWLKAIQEDSLTWTQVSDLKFWSSLVVPLYDIQGIPYNVLIDPNGTIIANNLTGAQLEQTLSSVLK